MIRPQHAAPRPTTTHRASRFARRAAATLLGAACLEPVAFAQSAGEADATPPSQQIRKVATAAAQLQSVATAPPKHEVAKAAAADRQGWGLLVAGVVVAGAIVGRRRRHQG